MTLLRAILINAKSVFHLAILPIKLEATGHAIIFQMIRRRTFNLKRMVVAPLLLNPAIYAISKLALKSNKVRQAFPSLAVAVELWIPFLLRTSVAGSAQPKMAYSLFR